MPPAVIAAAIMTGGSLAASKMASKSNKQALDQSKEGLQLQKQIFGEQSNLSKLLKSQFVNPQYKMGMETLGPAIQYYMTMLGGNRAAMSQATASERGQIIDAFRGAEESLGRSGVRGPQRDVELGKIARDRAGKIGGLTMGMRPSAAGALTDIGKFGVSNAGAGYGVMGNLLAGAGQTARGISDTGIGIAGQQRENLGAGASVGKSLMSIFGPMLLEGVMGGGGKGGGGLLPSKRLPINVGSPLPAGPSGLGGVWNSSGASFSPGSAFTPGKNPWSWWR